MLIIALVLALIGLVALVFAVVTSNELVAWVCIGASILGVVLLIIDALRERRRRDAGGEDHDKEDQAAAGGDAQAWVEYPEEIPDEGYPGDTALHESSEHTTSDAGRESATSGDGRNDDRTK
ncbi:phage holin family protein [Mycobacterium sp.]|uniref:phage holin family protein n=1 Tax=Mycobacterium sp. TaxID=1785 RepID=UPI0025F9F67E|nr:phage holin family protein [Mycobacterium sp.]MBW0013876.1 phage holin family protein [Mycobacterium sp.]